MLRSSIHEKILELCHNDDEFLLIGGIDKLKENLPPRDIDIFTTKTREKAVKIVKNFFEKAGLEYYLQVSPYGVLQFYIFDKETTHIELLDIIYKYSALRSRMFFLPKSFKLHPKIITIGKYNLYYDLNLLIIKNVYKPYIVGDRRKFKANKIFYKDYFDLHISAPNHTTLMINGNKMHLQSKYTLWLCLVFYEKIVNAFLVNIKNVIFDPNIREMQDKLRAVSGEIDHRFIERRPNGTSFHQSRKFLFLEMPISALKVTIISFEKYNFIKKTKRLTLNKRLLSFLEAIL